MFERIDIKNFRSHEKTQLDLSSGVNVIFGLSDSGKTNVIRALNWILTNRPLGYRIHSDFTEDPTSVSVYLNDDKSEQMIRVVLKKSPKESKYLITYSGGPEEDTVELKAIGSDVPGMVQGVFNVNDINIQKQLDEPFLICSSSAEVARVLNRVTRLEQVDELSSYLTTKINSKNKEIGILRNEQSSKSVAVDALEAVDEAESELRRLEIRAERSKRMKERIYGFEQACARIQKYQKEVAEYADAKLAREELDRLDSLGAELKLNWERLLGLSELVEGIRNRQKGQETQREHLKELAGEYQAFLKKLGRCPFCPVCTTDLSKHDLEFTEWK